MLVHHHPHRGVVEHVALQSLQVRVHAGNTLRGHAVGMVLAALRGQLGNLEVERLLIDSQPFHERPYVVGRRALQRVLARVIRRSSSALA